MHQIQVNGQIRITNEINGHPTEIYSGGVKKGQTKGQGRNYTNGNSSWKKISFGGIKPDHEVIENKTRDETGHTNKPSL